MARLISDMAEVCTGVNRGVRKQAVDVVERHTVAVQARWQAMAKKNEKYSTMGRLSDSLMQHAICNYSFPALDPGPASFVADPSQAPSDGYATACPFP